MRKRRLAGSSGSCRGGLLRVVPGWCLVVSLFAMAFVFAPGALAGSLISAGPCPNASLRTGASANLPDCRAYELVSPAFADGYEVFGGSKIAVSGELVAASSFGSIDGEVSTTLAGDPYGLMRTASGWTAIPFDDAPLAEFGYSPPFGVSAVVDEGANAGATLVGLHPASGSIYADELYRREPGGSRVLVGPLLPASAVPSEPTGSQAVTGAAEVVGASGDLSRVLFSIRSEQVPFGVASNLWPGDETVTDAERNGGQYTKSLYEYAGVGNHSPALVGVEDSGRLISRCGVLLGGIAGDASDAVSASGNTVFFTARPECPGGGPGSGPAVAELFARTEGTETTPISEPGASNEGCTTSACTGAPLSAANFEGASSDGSKVFFTSTQQLLNNASEDSVGADSADPDTGPGPEAGSGCDATTPGAGGCNLYEYEMDVPVGHRLTALSAGDTSGVGPNVQGVAAISEDGSHVYFVAKGVLAANDGAAVVPGSGVPQSAVAGEDNLYVFERDARFPEGHITFIATLEASTDSGQWSASGEERMNTTADGRYLVFTSASDLTRDDTSTAQQVFRYDSETGELVRVSVGEEGFNDDGNSAVDGARIRRPRYEVNAFLPPEPSHPSVSDEGVVVFESADGLTPQAIDDQTNTIKNVYEYENGSVYLISDGRDSLITENGGGSRLEGIDPQGRNIFIITHDQLVAQDTNTEPDIYDARVDGGFAAPATPVVCEGEGCQTSSVSPVFGAPTSATLAGGGNALPTPVSPQAVKSKVKSGKKTASQIRAMRLAKALRACEKKSGAARRRCNASALKRYAPPKPKTKSPQRGTHS